MHPTQASQVPENLKGNRALVGLFIRGTGELFFNNDDPNKLSRAYRISCFTCVMDQNNQPVPFDMIDIRVAVPGHYAIETPLDELTEKMRDLIYVRGDLAEEEKARVQAQATFTEDSTPIPISSAPISEYDPADMEEGLSRRDASAVLHEYLNRFEGGAILLTEDAHKTIVMLERIGTPLRAMPYVYRYAQDMVSILTMFALQEGTLSSLQNSPLTKDAANLTLAQSKDSMIVASAAVSIIVDAIGEGTIGPHLTLDPEEDPLQLIPTSVDESGDPADFKADLTIKNTGLQQLTGGLVVESGPLTLSESSFDIAPLESSVVTIGGTGSGVIEINHNGSNTALSSIAVEL